MPACVMAVTHDHSQLIVYGGYSKDRVKRDVDHGQVHCDMFALAFDSQFAVCCRRNCSTFVLFYFCSCVHTDIVQ